MYVRPAFWLVSVLISIRTVSGAASRQLMRLGNQAIAAACDPLNTPLTVVRNSAPNKHDCNLKVLRSN